MPGVLADKLEAEPVNLWAMAISAVTVITADRPTQLGRCLDALQDECELAAACPVVYVVDGSQHASNETRNVVNRPRRLKTVYIGQEEASAVRRTVGISPGSELEWVLTPGAVGASRNLAALLTAGTHYLTIDDDIETRGWQASKSLAKGALRGGDNRLWRAFNTRGEALAAATSSPRASVLRECERWLGSSPPFTGAADSGRGLVGRVVIASTGVAGDSGRQCASSIVFQNQTVFSMNGNERHLLEFLSSRDVICVAEATEIVRDGRCMAYCMAIDNASVLPPFMPVNRNEDGIFGAMLRLLKEDAVMVHVPIGVLHVSPRGSSYDEPYASARHITFGDVVYAAVTAPPSLTSMYGDDRWRSLSQRLKDFSLLSAREMREVVIGSWLTQRMALVRSACCDVDGTPLWKRTIAGYKEALLSSVASPDMPIPWGFRDVSDRDTLVQMIKRIVHSFGDLLDGWPSMWLRASRINSSGGQSMSGHAISEC